MKAVLISIKPRWCELIASGKKTVEVRKTRPKIDTPFKVYIYETNWRDNTYYKHRHAGKLGKVIGEFVCEDITDIRYYEEPCDNGFGDYSVGMSHPFCDYFAESTCLSYDELHQYLQGKYGYGWHISDLVIYDKPKELSEFRSYNVGIRLENGYPLPTHEITRPPQSWMYVESEDNK